MGVDLFSVLLGAEMNSDGGFQTVDGSLSLSSEKPLKNKVISQAIMIEDETNEKFYVPSLKIINGKPKLCLVEFDDN